MSGPCFAARIRSLLPRPTAEPKAESVPDKPKEVAAAAPPKEEEPDNTPPPTQMRPPDPKPDADDPGRPVLRRGAPAPRRETTVERAGGHGLGHATVQRRLPQSKPSAVPPAPVAPGSASQPIPLGDDPIITKAREAAFAYSETLPNYLVQQMTTRYQSDHPKASWQALDIVTRRPDVSGRPRKLQEHQSRQQERQQVHG